MDNESQTPARETFIFNPLLGERIGPAWNAAIRILLDMGWHRGSYLIEAMMDASPDLAVKTYSSLLWQGCHHGVLEWEEGNYSRRRPSPWRSRRIRLVDYEHISVRPLWQTETTNT